MLGVPVCDLSVGSRSESGTQEVKIMTYVIFVWHGVFLAITLAMIDFNTVFPALIADLGGSKVMFGALYAIMLGAPYLLNFLFGHYLSTQRYRRKFLILGIYLRAISFLGMAGSTYLFGERHPGVVLACFFFWILLFSISGGLAGISYSDIIGKLVKKGRRGTLFAAKQFGAGLAGMGGGLIVSRIITVQREASPTSYAAILLIGFVGLLIASIPFWLIREPASQIAEKHSPSLGSAIRRVPGILRRNPEFLRFVVVENLSSFGVMAMPFYLVFARERLSVSDAYIGRYLLFQMGGMILSNLAWGWTSKRFGSRQVVRICLGVGAAIPIVALALSHTSADLFSITFILVGCVMSGRKVGFEPYLLDLVPPSDRPVYLGIRGTMNVLVVILPILGGFLIQAIDYLPVFALVSAALVGGFVALRRGEHVAGEGGAPSS